MGSTIAARVMSENPQQFKISRGLVGIYADKSASTYIDGEQGILEYRGYSIHDLAEQSNFEETAYLLMFGELPKAEQLADFAARLRAARQLPKEVVEIIRAVSGAHPMDVLRTAVSALSGFDEDREDDSEEAAFRKGMRLTAQVPVIIMYHHRIANGEEPVEPHPDLNHAANFLYMRTGEEPSETASALMDKDFVLHADHGLNASAFTARVVTGTKADFHGAVTAAIAALSGPSHGGAAENVVTMAKEIGKPDRAKAYVQNLIDNRQRIMGFGHRVYKTEDPRARHLEQGVKQLSEEMGQRDWYLILDGVRQAMMPYSQRGIHANVDFFAGIMYHLLGLPQSLYVPIFAAGRVPGWTIQIVEQMRNNILIRPLLLYNGDRQKEYTPIGER